MMTDYFVVSLCVSEIICAFGSHTKKGTEIVATFNQYEAFMTFFQV